MYRNFELDKVTLTDNTFAHRRNLAKAYLCEFDIDRLMHTFRLNAGISSDAEPLGGWESPECGLRGHFVGHFLSACSKFAFADRCDGLKRKADTIVDIMDVCAKPNGYLSAFEEEKLDVLEFEEDRGVWAPYYTLHKILQGLIDCHRYLNNQKALALAVGLGKYIRERFRKLSDWKIDGMLRCTKVNPVNEFGGIGDALYSLYEITGDLDTLELAKTFDRPYFLDNLAAGSDVLENLHANTHLPMIIAAMHRYNITGEVKYKTAAVNFYQYLMGRTFVNGNSSSKATAYIKGKTSEKSEHWGRRNDLSDALTGGESESCCAHNTEKIAEQLFAWTGEVSCLKHLESLKFNAVLNSCSHSTGLSQYHQPMGIGASKKFSGKYDTFWCCTASGIEAMSELQKNIWFKGDGSILLNSFISSSVVWNEMDAVIEQNTRFPDDLVSTLRVRVKKPTEFKLILKDASVSSVRINSADASPVRENGLLVIHRVFENQDLIEIAIQAPLTMVPLKGREEMAAVMAGPVALAQLGREPYPEGIMGGELHQLFTRTEDSGLSLRLALDHGRHSRFIPLYRVEDEVYSVYASLPGSAPEQPGFTHAADASGDYAQ